MGKTRLIMIGASAGGVEALPALLGSLPADFPAAICVVLHISAQSPSHMPAIISRSAELPTKQAEHGVAIQGGKIYVAPPDRHLVVAEGRLHLNHGPKENRHRPAVDVLFRSAAHAFGRQVIGIVLTGYQDDGTAGLQVIKNAGGTAIVQDPADALVPGMPLNALHHVKVDHCVSLAKMPSLLVDLVRKSTKESQSMKNETPDSNEKPDGPIQKEKEMGPPSAFACPECSGALWESRDGNVLQYSCHVGHTFSPQSLLAAQSDELERSLYVAVRTLFERADLLTRLADQVSAAGASSSNFAERAREHREHAEVIRSFLEKNGSAQREVGRESSARTEHHSA